MSRQQGSESQGDFQEFTSLPDTQEINDQVDVLEDMADEVDDSGMEAGIDSGSDDDDNDENNDMIVLDPEHVCSCIIFMLNIHKTKLKLL